MGCLGLARGSGENISRVGYANPDNLNIDGRTPRRCVLLGMGMEWGEYCSDGMMSVSTNRIGQTEHRSGVLPAVAMQKLLLARHRSLSASFRSLEHRLLQPCIPFPSGVSLPRKLRLNILPLVAGYHLR